MALKLEVLDFGFGGVWEDITAYLRYGSLTLRLNTLDFELVDISLATPGYPSVQSPVRVNLQGWSGQAVVSSRSDLVDIASGHKIVAITATASYVAVAQTTGLTFRLGATPLTDDYLLEDGSGTYLLEAGSFEDPGSYEMEGGSYGYQALEIRSQLNTADLTVTNVGSFRVFQPGLWPGASFNLVTSNLFDSSSPAVMYVTQTTITFQGANPQSPVYDVEFSTVSPADIPPTLQTWRATG